MGSDFDFDPQRKIYTRAVRAHSSIRNPVSCHSTLLTNSVYLSEAGYDDHRQRSLEGNEFQTSMNSTLANPTVDDFGAITPVERGALKDSEEHRESVPIWQPFWLRKSVLVGFFCWFLCCTITLLILLLLSNRDGGIGSANQELGCLYRFAPTASMSSFERSCIGMH